MIEATPNNMRKWVGFSPFIVGNDGKIATADDRFYHWLGPDDPLVNDDGTPKRLVVRRSYFVDLDCAEDWDFDIEAYLDDEDWGVTNVLPQ